MTPFAVGRRWRTKERVDKACVQFEFIIVGPAVEYFQKTGKRCRLECLTHKDSETRPQSCVHGTEQNYTRSHLREYASLIDE